jgi:hypothetical protein
MIRLGLERFAKKLLERVKQDFDIVIGVTGTEGEGKSTFAIQLARAVGNFRLTRNVMFSPRSTDVKKLITSLPKYSPVILDEAIKVLYKLKWNDKIQKLLNEFYNLCRQENQISIMCMPRFTDFNEYFRNHRIKVWIHILERGVAVVFVKDTNPLSRDVWHIDEMEKRLKTINFNKLSRDSKIKKLASSQCFIGVIKYPKLPEHIDAKYKRLKELRKYDPSEEAPMKENEKMALMRKQWIKSVLYLKKFENFSGTKIANFFDCSPNLIRRIIYDNKQQLDEMSRVQLKLSGNIKDSEKPEYERARKKYEEGILTMMASVREREEKAKLLPQEE